MTFKLFFRENYFSDKNKHIQIIIDIYGIQIRLLSRNITRIPSHCVVCIICDINFSEYLNSDLGLKPAPRCTLLFKKKIKTIR